MVVSSSEILIHTADSLQDWEARLTEALSSDPALAGLVVNLCRSGGAGLTVIYCSLPLLSNVAVCSAEPSLTKSRRLEATHFDSAWHFRITCGVDALPTHGADSGTDSGNHNQKVTDIHTPAPTPESAPKPAP